MELETQRVWDYSQDGYVHRLVQNEIDGKLIELPLTNGEASADKSHEEKVDKIGLEYSQLLVTQLESQRDYFEEIVHSLEDKLNYHMDSYSKLVKKNNELQDQLKDQKKSQDQQKLIEEYKVKYEEEHILNEGLLGNISRLTKEVSKLKLQNEDLSEQLNDMMSHFAMQSKLAEAGGASGEIVIVPPKPQVKKTVKKGGNRVKR